MAYPNLPVSQCIPNFQRVSTGYLSSRSCTFWLLQCDIYDISALSSFSIITNHPWNMAREKEHGDGSHSSQDRPRNSSAVVSDDQRRSRSASPGAANSARSRQGQEQEKAQIADALWEWDILRVSESDYEHGRSCHRHGERSRKHHQDVGRNQPAQHMPNGNDANGGALNYSGNEESDVDPFAALDKYTVKQPKNGADRFDTNPLIICRNNWGNHSILRERRQSGWWCPTGIRGHFQQRAAKTAKRQGSAEHDWEISSPKKSHRTQRS